MKLHSTIGSVCLLALFGAFLAACGGGTPKSEGDASGLGACTPSSAAPGSTVVCEAKGITEDCTVFFGGKPVEFAYHPENETVEFTVPPSLPGEKSVHAQCGTGGVLVIEKNFNVPSAGGGDSAGEDDVPAEGGVGTGGTTGGEVITPSGGATTGGTAGPETPPADADGDGVADATDACPGTPSGTTVDSTGCPPPPPEPTGATISSFNVTKVTSGAEMNTVKIDWSFSGAKAAYVWGDFNREVADAALAASDQCKLVGTRHLVTGPDGKKLNTGSELYNSNQPFLEGVLCDNASASKDDDCKSVSSTAFRFGRPLEERDLYAVQLELKDQVMRDYTLEKKGTMIEVGPMIPLFVEETNPNCRIDLVKADASLITSATIYTRPLVQHAQFCLAAQGADDSWTVKCKANEAPEASLSVTTAQLTTKSGDNRPKVKVGLSYANVVSLPSIAAPAGCSPETGKSWPPLAGATGTLNALCDITTSGDLTTNITATARGIGENNKQTKKIVLTLGVPSLTFKWNNDGNTPFLKTYDHSGLPAAEDSGTVEFLWRVKRSYAIKDGNTNADFGSGDTHWIKEMKFYEGGTLKKTVPVGPGDDHGIVTMRRDHGATSWEAKAYDFNPSTVVSSSRSWGYEKSFNMSNWQHLGCWADSYDTCGDILEGDCGQCIDTGGAHMKGSVNWSGKGIKKITSSCDVMGVHGDVGGYGAQNGYVEGTFNTGNSFGSRSCDFQAEYYDGTKSGTWSYTWSCDC
jgi:hypothetical protein